MASTVQEFVNSVLRLIRVLDSGESPTATESNDALVALNQLISSWSAAGVPIYSESLDVIPMTGMSSYLMSFRPVRITAAEVRNSEITFPVAIVNSQQYSMPKDRSATSKFAKELYYDGAFPVGRIYLWPNVQAGSQLEIWSLKPLAQFASLGDTINLPPGYEQALRFALANVLAPEYGSALPPEVAAGAAAAQSAIANMNASVIGQAAQAAAVPAAT